MKKLILLTGLLAVTGSYAASAQVVIQPTFVEPAPAPIYAPPSYVVEPYPHYYYERHHHYDWRYWHDREHRGEHWDRDHRDWRR